MGMTMSSFCGVKQYAHVGLLNDMIIVPCLLTLFVHHIFFLQFSNQESNMEVG
jgi:hypothetical protein